MPGKSSTANRRRRGFDTFAFTISSTPSAADCARLLVEAGAAAEAVTTRIVPATWRLSAPDDLFDGFLAGTVRMAALLAAQPPAARAKIREAVAEAVGAFGRDGAFRVPTAAVLVSASAA